jgi:hypothetical protein
MRLKRGEENQRRRVNAGKESALKKGYYHNYSCQSASYAAWIFLPRQDEMPIGAYQASVVLIHFMRAGDQKLPVSELTKKYPFRKAREIVVKGWNDGISSWRDHIFC